MCAIEDKIRGNRQFTIDRQFTFSLNFPEISCSLLHETGPRKWSIRNCVHAGFHRCLHKMKWRDSAMTFWHYSKSMGELLPELYSHCVCNPWINTTIHEVEANFTVYREKNSNRYFPLKNIMCIVFWNSKEVLLVGFLPQGPTVSSDGYCDMLMKLCCAIQNMQHSSHPLARNTVQPRPYTKWLSPFPELKSSLSGQWFHDDEVKQAVKMWFKSQAATFYNEYTMPGTQLCKILL